MRWTGGNSGELQVAGNISASTLTLTGSATIGFDKVSGSTKPANNATANRTDAATDTAVNAAAKTGGSVGGWTVSSTAITSSNSRIAINNTNARIDITDTSGNLRVRLGQL